MTEPTEPTELPEAALQAELDCLLARAGLCVPEDRRAPMLGGYAELRRQVDLLRQPRSAAAEPSNVFRLTP